MQKIMPITKSMNDTAKLAARFLGDEPVELIRKFVNSQKNSDGGFKGRDGRSDLYYTLFGLECAEAVNIDTNWKKLREFLNPFLNEKNLDFVHTVCLIRCLNKIPNLDKKQNIIEELFRSTEKFRSNKGYKLNITDNQHSIYALFLAILAHEECKTNFPFSTDEMVNIIENSKTTDGAFADQPGLKKGTTTVTAAVILVLYKLGIMPETKLIEWVQKQYSLHGGFRASPLAPIPDLLSTGTAMFSLNYIDIDLKQKKEPTFDFVESIWAENGGFCGHIFEEEPDTEYTFYGLLTLGVLSKI